MIAAKHRDVYFPVTYVEPIAGNESTFGFDVGSTIAHRQTLDRAIVTGKIAMIPSVTLVQETTAKKGFFIVAPVFKKSTQQSSHGRLNKLEGFVMSIFVAEELVLNALKNTAEKNIQLTLLNQSSVTPETLYIHNIGMDKAIHFHYQLASVDNQDSRVEAFPSKTYVSNKRTHNPLIIALLVFLFFSVAIMYIFRQHKNGVSVKKHRSQCSL
jgi:CHASE1-domain containing sensor protein